jgi:hypothetical protein
MLRLEFPGPEQEFWATGDWHIGQAQHYAPLFDKHFQQAVSERWQLLHVGDAVEMLIWRGVVQSARLFEQKLSPEEQREELIACLSKLAGGVYLAGTHELRVDRATGLDFVKGVAQASGGRIIPLYIPQAIEVVVGKQPYVVFLHHGEGPIVSPTTLFDRIQRDVEGVDLIIAGHIHAATFDPAVVETTRGNRTIYRLRAGHYLQMPAYQRIRPIVRWGACGSYVVKLCGNERKIDVRWLGE